MWRGELDGRPVAVRRSHRSEASLRWELDLITDLDSAGFSVPTVIATDAGRPAAGGVVVQRWLDGRPPSTDADWAAVADELAALHRATVDRRQRPGCCTASELAVRRRSVDADLDAMPEAERQLVIDVIAELPAGPTAVVHGDPGPDNIRIAPDGTVGLLDWDESRVDLVWHDLSNLGCQVLDDESQRLAERLSHAWEAVNGWRLEPAYARRRLAALSRP